MRRRRALFLIALPLVACASVIGLDEVKYGNGPDGPDPTLEGGSIDGAGFGDIVDKPPLDAFAPDGTSEADADSGPIVAPARPDSSAGKAGVSCNGSTCSGSPHCCVDKDSVSCRASCESSQADYRCDDPFDCAAANKGCCGVGSGGFVVGSSCETVCSGYWFCITNDDCPPGLTCRAGVLTTPPGTKVCQ